MGCLNGKHVLTDEIMDYITNHTKASHDEIKQYHQMFLDEHPNGKITNIDCPVAVFICFVLF